MADLRTSVIVDLAGNLPRQAPRFGQQIEQLGTRGSRSMRMLTGSITATSRGLDRLGNRYTAFLTGAAGAAAVKGVMDFDAQLKQLAVDADITDEQLAKVKQRILDVANSPNIRVNAGELTAGVKEIVARTGELDVALDNLETLGITMRATGSAGEDSAALVANFFEKFRIRDPKQMLATLDEAALLGKEGAFELRDLATEGNSVSAAFAMTGRTGPIAAREMLTLLQIVRRTSSNAAEAGTSFERFIATLTSEKVGMLQKNGIKIWDPEELEKGNKMARPIADIVHDILKATGGDPEILSKIFDVRALRAMNAFALEFKETGALPSVEKFMNVVGDGSQIMEDASRNASTAAAAWQQLQNSISRAADRNLSEPLKDLADWADELDPEKVQRTFDAAITGAKILGAVWLANKGLRMMGGMIGGARKLWQGSKRGGVGGAAGMVGVTPVYVVNMGMGGMGGGLGGGLAGGIAGGVAGGGKGRLLLRAGMTGALAARMPVGQFARLGAGAVGTTAGGVLAAGAAGWGVGTLISKAIEGSSVQDAIGRTITRGLALFGNDDAQESLRLEREYKALTERDDMARMVAIMERVWGGDNPVGRVVIEMEGPARVKQLQAGGGFDLEAEQKFGPLLSAGLSG